MRSTQKELALKVSIRVDLLLDVGKQIGGVLHFVIDDRCRVQFQEPTRVFLSGHAHVRKLQRDVPSLLAEEMSQQRDFAGLARPGQYNGKEF